MSHTVRQLIQHLSNMVTEGMGDVPVYLVDLQNGKANPLHKGDVLRANGIPHAVLLVPHAEFEIKTH